MADIVKLEPRDWEPNLDGMGRTELLDCLREVRERLDQLNQWEPEDMDSEDFQAWGGRHEALEDLADEIQDILDELED